MAGRDADRTLLLLGNAPTAFDGSGAPDDGGLVALGGAAGAQRVSPARTDAATPSLLAPVNALLDARARALTAQPSRPVVAAPLPTTPVRAEAPAVPPPVRVPEPSPQAAPEPVDDAPRPPPGSRWNQISASVRGDRVGAHVRRSGGANDLPCTLRPDAGVDAPRLVFRSEDFPDEAWRLRSMQGGGAISDLYAYDIEIEACFDEGLDATHLERLLHAPASIAYGPDAERPTHGIVTEVELLTDRADETVVYRVRLAPRLWLLTQTRRSRVFCDRNVPEILRAVLRSAGFEDPTAALFDLPRSWDTDLARFPKREYTVQYDETDYDFLCRLAAHAGIFFLFAQGDGAERVVFGAKVQGDAPRLGDEPVPYRTDGGRVDDVEPVIALRGTRRRLPRQVAANEHNWRSPELSLAVSETVSAAGFGTVVLAGEHYKTEAEGRSIARVRAAELAASAHVYRGRSRLRGLAAGHRFSLEGHFDAEADREYFVLEVTHAARDGATATAGGDAGTGAYVNDFVAVPSDQPYAPPQRVPWPRVEGLLHGRIVGADNGMAAPVDDKGRYQIELPWAEAERPGEAVSRWVRRAQLSAGDDYGTHLPLHRGTEVLVAHVEGDPDRPVIVGAMHDEARPSPVTAANANASVMKTKGSIQIVMTDG